VDVAPPFVHRLEAVVQERLAVVGEDSRNPRAPWDGNHLGLPGSMRPLSVSRAESRFLANLVALSDCRTVLEIGTAFGYSTSWLAYGLSQCSHPHGVYTIDDGTEAGLGDRGLAIAKEIWTRTGVDDLVFPIRGTSPEVLNTLDGLMADVIFIDGEHRGDQPLRDWLGCLPHLAPSGFVIFHDVQEKYTVQEAVEHAISVGFSAFPIASSCEPVVVCRDETRAALISTAFELARQNFIVVKAQA